MSDASLGCWLITSGAYINQELAAEFGQLPPVFLPVGTSRLFEHQLAQIGRDLPTFLTLPESYSVAAEDERRLNELGCTIIYVPDGLSLGESVLFALNLIGGADRTLRILHGDTLVKGWSVAHVDQVGVSNSPDGYSWAEAVFDDHQLVKLRTVDAGGLNDMAAEIACGYFSFSSTALLVRCLTRCRGHFISAILKYAETTPLAPISFDEWLDFGHVQTYFRSRRLVTSARHFNTMEINGLTARKSSADGDKIRAEALWLQTVPAPVSIYTARLIDAANHADGSGYYETEYAYLPTLSELFVYGAIGPASWREIMASCREFLQTCVSSTTTIPANALLRQLTIAKTRSRLESFAKDTGFKIDSMLRYGRKPLPSLLQIADDLEQCIDLTSERWATVMHGDFCFSNILYDSRMRRIRVIDPRGYVVSGQPSTAGDIRYDMAKLVHSVIGRYDQIICGRYRLETADGGRFFLEFEQASHQIWLESEMKSFSVDGVVAGEREVCAICVCLFLSMLPLHSDRPDRQMAFVANALRLYSGLEAATS